MFFAIVFFHQLAFGGGERTGRKRTVVKAVDFDLVGWVFEDLVLGGCERWSIAVAFSSIAF